MKSVQSPLIHRPKSAFDPQGEPSRRAAYPRGRVYPPMGLLGCRVAGADALFRKEYAYASRDVIDDLMELNKHLNEK